MGKGIPPTLRIELMPKKTNLNSLDEFDLTNILGD